MKKHVYHSLLSLLLVCALVFCQSIPAQAKLMIPDVSDPAGEAPVREEENQEEAVSEETEEETSEEETEEEPEEIILNYTKGTIASGVSLYGRSLTGMTLEEAEAFVDDFQNTMLHKKVAVVTDAHKLRTNLESMGVELDAAGIKKSLSNYVLDGTYVECYRQSMACMENPVDLTFKIKNGKSSRFVDYFTEQTADWTSEPVNASISYMTGQKVCTPSIDGIRYDFAEGSKVLAQDLKSGAFFTDDTYKVVPTEIPVAAAITTEMVESYTIIGSYTTYYEAATTQVKSNRQQNLIVSSGNMNGSVFAPGARISALTMYRDVTTANGYMPALTIMGGNHVESVGGGICQTTTTLFNAVLYAELDIIYRSNHSMVSNYVPASRDAMVYYAKWDHYSNKYDFVFTNSTSGYLFIESFVDVANTAITVRLIGLEEHPEGHMVEYEPEILYWGAPIINIVVDPNLVNTYAPYATLYYQLGDNSPEPAMSSRLWKCTYQDGILISRDLFIAQDTYNAQSSTFAAAAGVSISCYQGGDYHNCYVLFHVDH